MYKEQAKQGHPVPASVIAPSGPFPRELFKEPHIVDDYEPAMNPDGINIPLGATAQNDFKPIKWVYCSSCYERVKAAETENHTCEA